MRTRTWQWVVLAALLFAPPLQAQTWGFELCGSVAAECTLGVSVSSVASAAAVGLPLTSTGMVVWLALNVVQLPPRSVPAPASQAATVAELYLRERAVDLAISLAAGSGPVLEDLAGGFGLPAEQLGRFGMLLQAHRRELSQLSDPARLDPARAVRFFRRLGELVQGEQVLAGGARGQLSRGAAGRGVGLRPTRERGFRWAGQGRVV